jgi:hypothetical protein
VTLVVGFVWGSVTVPRVRLAVVGGSTGDNEVPTKAPVEGGGSTGGDGLPTQAPVDTATGITNLPTNAPDGGSADGLDSPLAWRV